MPPTKVSFLKDVEPILTHAGCNQGACHGSQFGKGGFKLSLAGYDADLDYASIVKQAKGRRIAIADPTQSLLLRKPTMAVPHAGGLRLTWDSADYRTLVTWLQQGAPGPDPHDPSVVGLRVQPVQRTLKPGEKTALKVWAEYSDRTVREVTAHTRINTLNDSVALVTPEGEVTATGCGATAIMLRYEGRVGVTRIVVPYRTQTPALNWKPNTFVDILVANRWRELGLEPSPLCSDTEFLRRASLDILGTLPTPAEIRSFLADTDPDKRTKCIDRLLDRPEYADYWGLKWGDLLRSSRTTLGEKPMWSFTNWIRQSLRENRGYDRFVQDLLTAQGSAFSDGPTNYYRVAQSPQELAETTAQIFLGIRLQCARCHHHPFEKWSQQDYYQFAAFFARVGSKEGRDYGPGTVEPIVRLLPAGEVTHPKTGGRMLPTPLALDNGPRLTAVASDPDAAGDRRLALAAWLTRPDNPLFAQSVVNRYWSYFLGRGIVDPVDDMRVTNPPSNPELLDALAKDFVAHGYDLKHLIRSICTSRVYQLSSRRTERNRRDEIFYSHFIARRQPAEVLLDSVDSVTGAAEKFPGLPLTTRAIQLPDPGIANLFLDTFGRPPRTSACECERSAEPSLTQSLLLLNSDSVNRKVAQPGGRIDQLLTAGKSNREIVEELYLAALSRLPQQRETETALHAFAATSDRKQAAQDLLWALLNLKEFCSIQ